MTGRRIATPGWIVRGRRITSRSAMARLARPLSTLVAAAWLTGCGALDPRPDTARYFLLRPLAEPPATAPLDDLVLGVGPITLPDYLDRNEMLDVVGPYEMRYSAQNRWIEPLGDQLRRTISDNLNLLLRPDAVLAFPWYASDAVGLHVEITFDAMPPDDTGGWRGSARWVLREGGPGTALERNDFVFDLGGGSGPPEETARELSDEMSRLSAEIAEAIRRHHPG